MILGGGTGGTLVANRLARSLHGDARITVVDRDDDHLYQPGLLHLPFGMTEADALVRPRSRQLVDGAELLIAEIDRVETAADEVVLADGTVLPYDALVIATGAQLQPQETEGLRGPGWGERIFSFYTLPDALALKGAFDAFAGGRLVVAVVDMPIKCPVAPLEFAFLADWRLRERGLRQRSPMTYATPLDGAFTKPVAARHLGGLLEAKSIGLETEFATGAVDGEAGILRSWDGREIHFDMLVIVPAHGGADFVARSPGLGDELGFVRTERHILHSEAAANVFALGDAADLPTSKAGSAVHYQSEVVARNVAALLLGEEPPARYDGHVNCFIESGHHRALPIDFDYEREPLPGRFPIPHLGPLPLLSESHLNHLAKRAFQPMYWSFLLPAHDTPSFELPHGARGAAHHREEI